MHVKCDQVYFNRFEVQNFTVQGWRTSILERKLNISHAPCFKLSRSIQRTSSISTEQTAKAKSKREDGKRMVLAGENSSHVGDP